VGLTNRQWRPAFGVAVYLLNAGYNVIPIGPDSEVLGRKAYLSLHDVPVRIDLVDVFRRSENVPPHIEEAIAVGARAVWLQIGIRNPEAERLAEMAGLHVVADRCTKI
jgi:predicted CoA-binding protein